MVDHIHRNVFPYGFVNHFLFIFIGQVVFHNLVNVLTVGELYVFHGFVLPIGRLQ